MKREKVISFVCSACSYVQLSQAKTLSGLAAAAMRLARACLAELGRALSCQNGSLQSTVLNALIGTWADG